jgi:hypothetical protein
VFRFISSIATKYVQVRVLSADKFAQMTSAYEIRRSTRLYHATVKASSQYQIEQRLRNRYDFKNNDQDNNSSSSSDVTCSDGNDGKEYARTQSTKQVNKWTNEQWLQCRQLVMNHVQPVILMRSDQWIGANQIDRREEWWPLIAQLRRPWPPLPSRTQQTRYLRPEAIITRYGWYDGLPGHDNTVMDENKTDYYGNDTGISKPLRIRVEDRIASSLRCSTIEFQRRIAMIGTSPLHQFHYHILHEVVILPNDLLFMIHHHEHDSSAWHHSLWSPHSLSPSPSSSSTQQLSLSLGTVIYHYPANHQAEVLICEPLLPPLLLSLPNEDSPPIFLFDRRTLLLYHLLRPQSSPLSFAPLIPQQMRPIGNEWLAPSHRYYEPLPNDDAQTNVMVPEVSTTGSSIPVYPPPYPRPFYPQTTAVPIRIESIGQTWDRKYITVIAQTQTEHENQIFLYSTATLMNAISTPSTTMHIATSTPAVPDRIIYFHGDDHPDDGIEIPTRITVRRQRYRGPSAETIKQLGDAGWLISWSDGYDRLHDTNGRTIKTFKDQPIIDEVNIFPNDAHGRSVWRINDHYHVWITSEAVNPASQWYRQPIWSCPSPAYQSSDHPFDPMTTSKQSL